MDFDPWLVITGVAGSVLTFLGQWIAKRNGGVNPLSPAVPVLPIVPSDPQASLRKVVLDLAVAKIAAADEGKLKTMLLELLT